MEINMLNVTSFFSSCFNVLQENRELSRETTISPSISRRVTHMENPPLLRTPPVWLVTAKIPLPLLNGRHTRSHSFVMVGDPGKGSNSGAQYYAINSDDKRSRVIIDDSFIQKTNNNHRYHNFSNNIRAAVESLLGRNFSCIEGFHKTYTNIRQKQEPNISPNKLMEEVKALTFLIPSEHKEMWIYENNGKESTKPNLGERDVRMFENVDLSEIDKVNVKSKSELYSHMLSGEPIKTSKLTLRYLPNTDPIALIEAKRDLLLQRLYMDELYERNGTLLPCSEPNKGFVPPDILSQIQNKTPTYKMLPPFTPLQGNCSTGAATILRKAGTKEEDILACSPRNYGLHHPMYFWKPILGEEILDETDKSDLQVDNSTIRNHNPDTTDIEVWIHDRQYFV